MNSNNNNNNNNSNNNNLARELRKLWNTKILVVPVVVGALKEQFQRN
jgi:hypothetical protein